MQTNTKGFAQLVETIADLMEHPSNTDSTGITLHRDLGWRLTFQSSDIETEDEVSVVSKNYIVSYYSSTDYLDLETLSEHLASGDGHGCANGDGVDARAAADWIRDHAVEWILDSQDRLDECGIKNARLTRAEIEAHLA